MILENVRTKGALAILALLLVLAGSCRNSDVCSVCERKECGNLKFTIQLQDGKKVDTCCARCGLRYVTAQHAAVASLSVRDFEGAQTLDAKAAFYVEGSDVTPCTAMHQGPPATDEHGCCMTPKFDRCLPSVLAFRSKERADGFMREHGGAVKSLAEVEAGVARPEPGASPGS